MYDYQLTKAYRISSARQGKSAMLISQLALIMTYDTAKKLTGITEQTGILAVKNSEGRFDEVLTAVQKISDKNEKIEVNTI